VIDLTRALRHLGWADDWMFDRLADLPPEALLARYTPESWSVARLALHIVGGAQWYRYCLTGTPESTVYPGDLDLEELRAHVLAQRAPLADINALLVEQASLPDDLLTIEEEGRSFTALRSTILSQACLHGVEHRAQISCALEVNGYTGFALDDIDLWAFETYERGTG
jgi:uncharacterized damage-inducible protein DinB